jgi:hypothetical protein
MMSSLEMPMVDSTLKERRRQQRIRFEAPATVTARQHPHAASTKDISSRGLFFFTDTPFKDGSEIDITFTLPEKLGLPASGMVCCHGRVVRVDSTGGQYGIGVTLDRLDVVQPV